MNLKIIFVVLFVAIVSVCVWKWNIWFGKIEEASYDTPSKIDRIVLSLGEDVATQRSLAWRCDTFEQEHTVVLIDVEAADTSFIVGQATFVETQGGKSVFYRAGFNGLEPGKEYRYSIRNAKSVTPEYSFKMGDSSSSYSFIYFGDIQDKTSGLTGTILKKVMGNHPEADFFAFGGDMIERPLDKYWNIWYDEIGDVPTTKPFVACTGNHEYFKGVIKELDKRWVHSFPLPQNGADKFKGRCAYLIYKNTLFLILDTDGICEPLALKKQYAWAKAVLKNNPAKWKIVLMHHPIRSLRGGRLNLACCFFFKPLFEKYGVDLVMQGHDHGYARDSAKDDQGNSVTPVCLQSSCSSKFYTPTVFDEWDRMAAFRKMYHEIKVSEDSLTVNTYDAESGFYDRFSIEAKSKAVFEDSNSIPELLEPSSSLIKKGGAKLKEFNEKAAKRKEE